jgi:hypothetical protein
MSYNHSRKVRSVVKYPTKSAIQDIEKSVNAIKVQSDAPVDKWNPKFCGNLDIRISKDGSWFYEGSKINRINLVKLFSSILKKEGKDYFLVTPVEKIGITVELAPFVANSLDSLSKGKVQKVLFTTNVGDTINLDYNHPLRIAHNAKTNEPIPYVTVRRNLEALIDRKNFYRLIDLGCIETYKNDLWFGVWSNNCFFPIILNKFLSI